MAIKVHNRFIGQNPQEQLELERKRFLERNKKSKPLEFPLEVQSALFQEREEKSPKEISVFSERSKE